MYVRLFVVMFVDCSVFFVYVSVCLKIFFVLCLYYFGVGYCCVCFCCVDVIFMYVFVFCGVVVLYMMNCVDVVF